MTVKNPKDKGSTYERKISRLLSLWWSQGKDPDVFWRSVSSGAMATNRSKQGKSTNAAYGDITTLSPTGEPFLRTFTVELKKYGNLDMMSLIDSRSTGLFGKFWEKLVKECDEANKAGWGSEPLLITCRNNRKSLVTMHYKFYLKLVDYCGALNAKKPMIAIRQNGFVTKTLVLDDFLDWLDPMVVRTLWNLKQPKGM